jgi:hypothetical protein
MLWMLSMGLVRTAAFPDKIPHASECNLGHLSINKLTLSSKKLLIGIQSCGSNGAGTELGSW